MRRLTSARASIAPRNVTMRNIIAIFDPELSGELGRNFREHLRLQLGEMTEEAPHAAGGVMLGQPVGGEHKRKSRIARRREAIFLARVNQFIDRVRVARVKRVVHRRLERFVVRRHRPVLQTFRDIKPAETVFVQNERRVAAESHRARFRFRSGRKSGDFILLEIRDVDAGPFLFALVPPDEFLASRSTARRSALALALL